MIKETSRLHQQPEHLHTQSGFTLIELMIVVTIMAIFASIAVPSYRGMTVKNAEAKAESRVKQLQLELDSWRANTLSFKGFAPKKVATDGTISYAYDAENKTIFLPEGKDATSADYQITITNSNGDSLLTTTTLANVTTSNSWQIFVTPLNRYDTRANRYYIDSTGMRCKSKSTSFTLTTAKTGNCTGTGVTSW